jgi:hypothetical protein
MISISCRTLATGNSLERPFHGKAHYHNRIGQNFLANSAITWDEALRLGCHSYPPDQLQGRSGIEASIIKRPPGHCAGKPCAIGL